MRQVYKTIRATLMAAVLAVVAIYLLLYIALSLPFCQNIIKQHAEKFLSEYLDTEVSVGNLRIMPFNQVVIKDFIVKDKEGVEAVKAGKLGAGIDIISLIFKQRLIFTHAELIKPEVKIYRKAEKGPLNIDFIIDAFKPKDKNKPPAKFDFKIANIILRQGKLYFDNEWKRPDSNPARIDFNHLRVTDIKADISLPEMRNDDFSICIRRLSLKEMKGFELESLAGNFHISPTDISFSGLSVRLPETEISLNDQKIAIKGYSDIKNALCNGEYDVRIRDSRITPSDLSAFLPALEKFDRELALDCWLEGGINDFTIKRLSLNSEISGIKLDLAGKISHIRDKVNFSATISRFLVRAGEADMSALLGILPSVPANAKEFISRLGDVETEGKLHMTGKSLLFDGKIATGIGSAMIDGKLLMPARGNFAISSEVRSPGIDLGKLLATEKLGMVSFETSSDITIRGKDISGNANAVIPQACLNGKNWNDIKLDISKQESEIKANIFSGDPDAQLSAEAFMTLAGKESAIKADGVIHNLNFANLGIHKLEKYSLGCTVSADIHGIDPDNIAGKINITDTRLTDKENKTLDIKNIYLDAEGNPESRRVTLASDYLTGEMSGSFRFRTLPQSLASILHRAFPDIIEKTVIPTDSVEYRFNILRNNTLLEYLGAPVRLLTNIPVYGRIDAPNRIATMNLDCDYLQQGKDKLIKKTKLQIDLNGNTDSYTLSGSTILPGKNGDIGLSLGASASNNVLSSNLSWKFQRDKRFDGKISLDTRFPSKADSQSPIQINVNESQFAVNDTVWTIHPSEIFIKEKNIRIDNLLINNENQFVSINGTASPSPSENISVNLKNIDLDYIFETLNINYVTFGGRATGLISGSAVFSSSPVAETKWLKVKNLSYNNAVLGDATISSHWDNKEKKVAINADISDQGHRAAVIDGGIWVTRDSLSFALDADKVNIEFLQPFMAAFSSDVKGRASGNALLYGTFSDIDLTGKIFADTIALKLDYTNCVYHGSDSVYLSPGKISIPGFRLYDKYGNSGMLRGTVSHRYFHEPKFEFRINDARNLLCYDTNEAINPIWYGTVFGNGGGRITGYPGQVDIMIDMSTAPKSRFTFVLSDTEDAEDYKFLTFTDKKKERHQAEQPDTTHEIEKLFKKRIVDNLQNSSSAFNIDIRTTITPDAEMILVMDPIAGDCIKAFGSGALQIAYGSSNDKMTMYGKYTLEKGSYNFSLQDLIIKDFVIRPGSTISFNGDPLNARLDIKAAYKVNTSLTDLDKSFATDKDLNRTNVPVEAILKVNGDLQNPEIGFDIELPTLTQNVERKVKSIISTDDMMQRQIIYLLALNRFYAPEYMGGGSNNELSSIASSTLSSQLSRLMSNLTDKWMISPYFHSDNGQFTDMEVDLALSSSLLNNRLLLNGNLGYRDKSTSSTTFIGDFDIEYLLNRRGSLRLKAYNHYNDKNYYLKSSLTTQGVGIMYKHDFNRWFGFLKKWRRPKKQTEKSSGEKKRLP